MLTLKQIEELRTHLKTAENPLFFYDDDPDGICSYLLLKKYVEKGKGVILKASPRLDINLKRKLEEHYPDKIFVLDIPIITQEFIDIAKSPIYWIDHHPPLDLKGVLMLAYIAIAALFAAAEPAQEESKEAHDLVS